MNQPEELLRQLTRTHQLRVRSYSCFKTTCSFSSRSDGTRRGVAQVNVNGNAMESAIPPGAIDLLAEVET